jgi:hypothetical protein
MKRIVLILLFVAMCACTGNAQKTSKPVTIFVIHHPTIIAFFPITQAEADSGEDNAEALDDFNYYIFKVDKRLQRAGISIQITNALSFQIQTEKKLVTFRPKKTDLGYYFIAPGKEPHIEYNVMTDDDILDAARKYFGLAIR